MTTIWPVVAVGVVLTITAAVAVAVQVAWSAALDLHARPVFQMGPAAIFFGKNSDDRFRPHKGGVDRVVGSVPARHGKRTLPPSIGL
jgi:hypothetical protein